MLGVNIKTLVTDAGAMEAMLMRAQEADPSEFEGGKMAIQIALINKYTGSMPCSTHITLGGEGCHLHLHLL